MGTLITDPKAVFPEFKYFKNLYVPLNIAEKITFSAIDGHAMLKFSDDNEYYKMYGELLDTSSMFMQWLLQYINTVTINYSDIQMIGKCLKKNAIEIEYDSKHFKYKFNIQNKDGELEEKEVLLRASNTVIDFECQEFDAVLTNSGILTDDYLKGDVCEIYRKDDGTITNERTNEKLLEIPVAKIESLLKNGNNLFSFSDVNNKNQRYVSITSSTDALKLTQYMRVL